MSIEPTFTASITVRNPPHTFVDVRAKSTPDLTPQTAENKVGTLADTPEVVPESG
jgi:hypothetical protein